MNNTLQIAPAVSEKQAAAWIGIAAQKNEVTAKLLTAELAAQSILTPVASSVDHVAIDAALGIYRKAHTEIVELRKEFTAKIDASIIQPMMAYEKRIDPKTNESYLLLTGKSLELRQAATKAAADINAKATEKSRFIAHCANEFSRIAEDLRTRLNREITNQYKIHLQAKEKPDTERIGNKLIGVIGSAKQKFPAVLLTGAELNEIYTGLTKPDFASIYNDAKVDLVRVFANFDSDLANADAAIKHQEEQQKLEELEATQRLSEEQAINTLIATAETVVIDTPTIKKNLSITIIESEGWAKTVMAAFIVNMPHMAKYIRVKSWAKLSIGQMAEYLAKHATETGELAKGLQYEEVCK
jgi:hypothetical protein